MNFTDSTHFKKNCLFSEWRDGSYHGPSVQVPAVELEIIMFVFNMCPFLYAIESHMYDRAR